MSIKLNLRRCPCAAIANTLGLVRSRIVQVLNLSHNQIIEIELNALHQVSIFSTLDVSFNRIQTIRQLGLVRLLRLDASHNRIETIDSQSFVGLHQTFQELDLSFNNFTEFYAARLFHQTNNLLRLNIGMYL